VLRSEKLELYGVVFASSAIVINGNSDHAIVCSSIFLLLSIYNTHKEFLNANV